MAIFENLKLLVKQCYQTGQFKLDKNWKKMPKFENFKCDILGNFQTMCDVFGSAVMKKTMMTIDG